MSKKFIVELESSISNTTERMINLAGVNSVKEFNWEEERPVCDGSCKTVDKAKWCVRCVRNRAVVQDFKDHIDEEEYPNE
jgi:hypothetical protein